MAGEPNKPAPAAVEIEELERKEDAGTIEPGEQARLDVHRIFLKHGPLIREALHTVAPTPASHSDLSAREEARRLLAVQKGCPAVDVRLYWHGPQAELDEALRAIEAALSQKPATPALEDDHLRGLSGEANAAAGWKAYAEHLQQQLDAATLLNPPDYLEQVKAALDQIGAPRKSPDGMIHFSIIDRIHALATPAPANPSEGEE